MARAGRPRVPGEVGRTAGRPAGRTAPGLVCRPSVTVVSRRSVAEVVQVQRRPFWASKRCASTDRLVNSVALEVQDLSRFVTEVFRRVGMTSEDAGIMTRSLVEADLHGVGTHGVARVAAYVSQLNSGQVNAAPEGAVIAERPAALLLDAGDGFGAPVGNPCCRGRYAQGCRPGDVSRRRPQRRSFRRDRFLHPTCRGPGFPGSGDELHVGVGRAMSYYQDLWMRSLIRRLRWPFPRSRAR